MRKKSEVGVRGGVRGYVKYQYDLEKNDSMLLQKSLDQIEVGVRRGSGVPQISDRP